MEKSSIDSKSTISSKLSYPLSEGQKALWILYQLHPSSRSYNLYATFKIISPLNIEAWCLTWKKLIERHSILRTTYTTIEGQPVQQIHSNLNIPIAINDARDWTEEELDAQIFAETDHLFDLKNGPIIRICLFCLSTNEHIQLITMHHIAGDLWSFDILLEDFQILYSLEIQEKFSNQNKQELKLRSHCLSYSDYVKWQSSMLQGNQGQELQEYWQKQLSGDLPIVNLPFQQQRLANQALNAGSYITEIDPKLIERLKFFAKSNQVSLYRVMLTTFKILLYRYIGYEDIIVGSPMACRWGKNEFKHIVGFFSNIAILRTNLAGNPTFRELLVQVDQVVTSAQMHQDYPFSWLIRQLQQDKSTHSLDLVKTIFTWQKQRGEQKADTIQMIPMLKGHQRGVLFELSLSIMEAGDNLQANWRYNPDLFDSEPIISMARHFQNLLESILTNPDQSISQLAILTEAERHNLLVEWNQTKIVYPEDKCIHNLIEQQVERTPNAIAIVCGNQQLTYQALNQRANRIAHHLQSLGSDHGMLVGLYMERSIEMVVGLLGILKAGAAYLPLDPNYPQERLAYMLSDSQSPILLTQHKLVNSLQKQQIRIVYIEDVNSDVNSSDKNTDLNSNPHSNVTPQDLAYVIYTSGSTGKPKGVEIRHQSLVNVMFYRVTQLLDKDALNAIALTAPLSFDASVGQLFAPLLVGGKSVIVDNLFALPTCPQFQEITCIGATPSIIDKFIDDFPLPDSLNTLILGGEAVSQALLEKLSLQANVKRIINLYGPTEVTVHCTAAVLLDRTQPKMEFPNIGRPIANSKIYILDAELQPVPINISGEIYVGGTGLARGYLNQPQLTSEKFIVNPFSLESSSHLYKTGDLARYLPNGKIEFLGRIDSQLKIRGFRIELAEIESALVQYSSIQEAIVIADSDNQEDKVLIAYFTSNHKIEFAELRTFLMQKLPSYMVPANFVQLDQFPLTANGKIDRQNLPMPARSHEVSFVAPRNDTEKKLAKLWSALFKVKKISVYDNFFELGGHSLLSAKLFTQIENTFQIALPLSVIFDCPTIDKLAKMLQSPVKSSIWQPLVPIVPLKETSIYPPLFCISGIYGNVLIYADLAKYLGSDQPFYGLQPLGIDGLHSPLTSIEEIATYYIQVVRTLQPKGPYFLGGFSLGSKVVWEMAQQLHQQGEKVALLALFDGTIQAANKGRLAFHQRILLHYQSLREMGFTYISQKSPAWQDWLIGRYQYWTKRIMRRFYQRLQWKLPIYLRQSAIEESLEKAGIEALRNYVMQSYPDKVTLFRADTQASDQGVGFVPLDWDLGWGNLAAGGLEIQTISGNHMSMFHEPQVQVLAQKLQECLHRARQAQIEETA